MAYIALYRKYRSQTFGELMGQDAVTTVLQNSLRSGKIAHAYLFYGARGCGKTSTARLLSRALNCEAQDGPTPEPCGTCRICVAIRNGACMDVVEIDAASETGVDNVREKIIENVQYVPTEARYKVYIIDEVHDLSAKAFDALLKTLEEPPPHVVFVLATTEQHKVPITIWSRCIPFQFKRGSLTDLSAAIERVITAEGFTAEPEAIRIVARCAEGSWRDALSLLEQVIAYSGDVITAATVQNALGTVGTEILSKTVATIAANNWADTLASAGDLIDSGKDVRQLITSISGYLRDLLLIASGARQTAIQELGPERVAALTPQASLFTPQQLLSMMSLLAIAEKDTRLSNQHRWLLERTFCALMPANLKLSELHHEVRSTSSSVRSPSPSESPARPADPVRKTVNDTTSVVTPTVPQRVHETTASQTHQQVTTASPPKVVVADVPDEDTDERQSDRFAGEINLTVVQRAWPRIVKPIDKVSPSAAGYLKNAEVFALEAQVIVLVFSDSFARDRIINKGKPLVEKKINEVLQTEGMRIRARQDGEDGASTAPGIGDPNAPSPSPVTVAPMDLSGEVENPKAKQKLPTTTLLEETLEVFGGEVIRSE